MPLHHLLLAPVGPSCGLCDIPTLRPPLSTLHSLWPIKTSVVSFRQEVNLILTISQDAKFPSSLVHRVYFDALPKMSTLRGYHRAVMLSGVKNHVCGGGLMTGIPKWFLAPCHPAGRLQSENAHKVLHSETSSLALVWDMWQQRLRAGGRKNKIKLGGAFSHKHKNCSCFEGEADTARP